MFYRLIRLLFIVTLLVLAVFYLPRWWQEYQREQAAASLRDELAAADLAQLEAALDGELHHAKVQWDPRPSLGVVLAAGGYPGKVRSGDVIDGLEGELGADAKEFHAGTRLDPQGRVTTAGGRVLTVCALGKDVAAARERAYAVAATLRFEGMFYRRDIAHRALHRAG